jgi:hypothetical protein
MSNSEQHRHDTQHAFLVAWGWFAEHLGLIQHFQAVFLKQKHYQHRPQTKVLEFLVAILAGLQHLQDISRAAHPLDKDQAVAQAWGQATWADYSGVSRTLRSLSWEEVKQLVQVLDQISQPYLDTEMQVLRSQSKRVRLDGDLTGLPVSNTSRTYPHAAFGHMDDDIRLGYQAGVVSLESPTYGRLWLSVAHQPGDTVSCTQAEVLVLAAEARLHRRPRRRTELLRQRIAAFEQQVAQTRERWKTQQQAVKRAQERLAEAQQQVQARQQRVDELTTTYQTRQLQDRPTGRLAQARSRVQAAVKRATSRTSLCEQAQRRLDKTTAQVNQQHTALAHLYERLHRFEQDNAANADPLEAEFRLDAGFGTYENVALLIEMGYDLYTKPHSHTVVTALKRHVDDTTTWTRVGANAELVAWSALQLKPCPYPLNVALERFYTGKTLKHSALLHFGAQRVTEQLPGWFAQYNGRQTIEAGIKESKQVFYLHHLKVRSEPAIYLQEAFVLFAANFIRWASHWLEAQAHPGENALNVRKLGVKRQVHVAAHVSAQVIWDAGAKLLKFSEQSAFAGQVLRVASDHPSPQHAKC